MASFQPVFAFLLTILLLPLLISPNHASSNDDDDKVTLSLYYESLCPYCANFIANQLGKVFETDLSSVVNLRLVPWGNTQRTNNSWICQHGRNECALDIVEACAIHIWPDPAVHFKFIQCIEKGELEGRQSQWKSCYGALKLNPKPLSDCYTTRTGIDLVLKYADETDHLNPPHRFVPWVLVDNKPLQEDYQNFVAYICKAYSGRRRPNACQQRFSINSFSTKSSTTKVCYRGKAKMTSLSLKDTRRGSAKASSSRTHEKKETLA
ncbi:hypothetical protein LguiB_015502 [Lonicera macranthoides]